MKRKLFARKLSLVMAGAMALYIFTPEILQGADAINSQQQSPAIQQNPIGYSGYNYDRESGFYYLKARHFDPVLKTFLTLDTYSLANRYAYCNGNPVSNVDPLGHDANSLIPFYNIHDWADGGMDGDTGNVAMIVAGIIFNVIIAAGIGYGIYRFGRHCKNNSRFNHIMSMENLYDSVEYGKTIDPSVYELVMRRGFDELSRIRDAVMVNNGRKLRDIKGFGVGNFQNVQNIGKNGTTYNNFMSEVKPCFEDDGKVKEREFITNFGQTAFDRGIGGPKRSNAASSHRSSMFNFR